MTLPPPLTALVDLDVHLAEPGYAVLSADDLARLAGLPLAALTAWAPLWNDLPADGFLKDGGRYRRRRHGCFVVTPAASGSAGSAGSVQPVPHRAHWQPVEYNALHGGIERWFAPLQPEMAASPAWSALLCALAGRCATLRGDTVPGEPWFVEAHPFRIDTTDGIGRPTPEGAHRDGVDLVAVVLVARQGVKGGETRVFDAVGPQGLRFTLTQPWSVLLLDDARVVHESTPIQPLDGTDVAWRDTLVITFRRGDFQGPSLLAS